MDVITKGPDIGASYSIEPVGKIPYTASDGLAELYRQLELYSCREKWTVTFSGSLQAVKPILDILHSAKVFTWTTPFGDTLTFTASNVQETFAGAEYSEVSAELMQEFLP